MKNLGRRIIRKRLRKYVDPIIVAPLLSRNKKAVILLPCGGELIIFARSINKEYIHFACYHVRYEREIRGYSEAIPFNGSITNSIIEYLSW